MQFPELAMWLPGLHHCGGGQGLAWTHQRLQQPPKGLEIISIHSACCHAAETCNNMIMITFNFVITNRKWLWLHILLFLQYGESCRGWCSVPWTTWRLLQPMVNLDKSPRPSKAKWSCKFSGPWIPGEFENCWARCSLEFGAPCGPNLGSMRNANCCQARVCPPLF